MKPLRIFFITLSAFLLTPSIVSAGDFDWMRHFNLTAQADPSGFRAQLETRFQIGDAKIRLVLGHVDSPADAYMLLRLGEMSHQPLNHVLETYREQKNKGWGALAKNPCQEPGDKARISGFPCTETRPGALSCQKRRQENGKEQWQGQEA
jgi:hypothetical protein